MNHAQRQQHSRNIDMALAVLDIVREPGEALTLEEIADICGCTRSCVLKIERKALKKLRQNSGVLNQFHIDDTLPAESNSINQLQGVIS